MEMLKLWRYNPLTGYYVYVRSVSPDTADQWKVVFEKDDPTAIFVVSRNRPRR